MLLNIHMYIRDNASLRHIILLRCFASICWLYHKIDYWFDETYLFCSNSSLLACGLVTHLPLSHPQSTIHLHHMHLWLSWINRFALFFAFSFILLLSFLLHILQHIQFLNDLTPTILYIYYLFTHLFPLHSSQ